MTPYIGLPLWYNTLKKDYSIVEIKSLIQELRSRGIDLYEISIDYPWTYKDNELLYSLLDILVENKVHIGIHGPWRDLFYSTPYEDIRKATINTLKNVLSPIINRYHVEYIVIHLTSMQRSGLGNNYHDMVKAARKSIDEISQWLNDYGIYLCIENVSKGFNSKPEDLATIMENNVYIALDIAHLYATYLRHFINAYTDFNEFLEDCITMIGFDRILAIHFHDVVYVGNNVFLHVVEHILPGKGILKYKDILKKLSSTRVKYLLIEAFIDSKGRHLKLHQVADGIREFLTWLKIYFS